MSITKNHFDSIKYLINTYLYSYSLENYYFHLISHLLIILLIHYFVFLIFILINKYLYHYYHSTIHYILQ